MKKKILSAVLVLLTLLCSVALFACSQTAINEDIIGTYYKITADGASDTLRWIELKENGRFSNETKLSGSYVVKGEKITLTAAGEKTLVGTVIKGEIKLESGEVFCKEGVTPSDFAPKEDVYFTVSFDSDGGTAVAPKSVKNGSRVAEPETPTKDGYVFYGWYTDRTYRTVWNFKTMLIESDLTVYARFVPEQGKITSFVAGEGEDAIEGKIDGENILFVAEKGTEQIDLTQGITLNDEGEIRIYSDKKAQKEIKNKILTLSDGNNAFYIKTQSKDGKQSYFYTLNAHRKYDVEITCYFDEASLTPLSVLTATTYTELQSDFFDGISVTGYEILGWTDKHGNNVKLGENGTIFTEKTTLYALTEPNEYTLSYDADGGKTKGETKKVRFDSDYSLEVPYLEGYSFKGWTIGETFVTDEFGKSLAPYSLTSDETVKAVYEINSYYVFVNNDDDAAKVVYSGKIGTGKVVYDYNDGTNRESDELIYPVPEKDGYIFGGWFINADCSGEPYAFDEEIDKKTVLYAKWVSVGSAKSLTAVKKTAVSVSSPAGEKEYYAFLPLTDDSDKIDFLGAFPFIAHIYDEEKNLLASSLSGADGLSYEFERNKLYYIRFVGEFREGNTEITINGTQTPEISGEIINQKVNFSESVTVTVVPLSSPYVWLGWYVGNEKVSEENDYSYTFDVPSSDVVLTAKWAKITASPSDENAGKTSVSQKTLLVGDEVTVNSKTLDGYVWVGWFNGDEKLSADYSYTFTATADGADLTAKWIKVSLINSDEKAGSINSTDELKLVAGELFTATAAGNDGYVFVGWFINNEKVSEKESFSYAFVLPEENLKITARWCSVTVISSDETLGKVEFISDKAFYSGEEVSVTAVGNTFDDAPGKNEYYGAVWLGWFIGEEKVSEENSFTYVFAMPESNLELVAKWAKITLNKNCDGGEIALPNKVFVDGEEVEVTATVKNNFAWLGFYDENGVLGEDNEKLSYAFSAQNATITATWTDLGIDRNDPDAGEIVLPDRPLTLGEEIAVSVTTNDGYAFLGFYDGDERISGESSLTLTVNSEPYSYVAKWARDDTAAISKNINGGIVSSSSHEKQLTLEAIVYPGYGWLGWFVGEKKISDGSDLTVTVPYPENKTVYTAKFVKCRAHVFGENCVCTVCGLTVHDESDCYCSRCGKAMHVEQSGGYCRHSDEIYMGFYPQTQVTDVITLSYLNYASEADTLNGWTSFGFKANGIASDYAFYKDVVAGNDRYRGVYFSKYRPHNDSYDAIASNSNMGDNGYSVGTVYWFKYEPVKWTVIATDENFGLAAIIPELVLACGNFDSLNDWFVENFAPVAFDQRVSEVFGSDLYEFVNTLPLSVATDKNYGYDADPKRQDEKRVKSGTDYAKALGLFVNGKTAASSWIIGDKGEKITVVQSDGSIIEKDADDADCGIVPVLLIKLKTDK